MFLASGGAADVAKILGKKPDAAFLQSLDKDGSGDVTELEYLSAMLVRLQFVEQDKIDQIMKAFHKLDADGSGTLSIDDLVADMDKDDDDADDDSGQPSPGGVYSFSAKVNTGTASDIDSNERKPQMLGSMGQSLKIQVESRREVDIIAEAEELLATQVDHATTTGGRRNRERRGAGNRTRASARTGVGSEPQVEPGLEQAQSGAGSKPGSEPVPSPR